MPAKRKKAAKLEAPARKKRSATRAKKGRTRSKKRHPQKQKRWPATRLLDEARMRTRQLGLDAKPEVQQMLTALLDEAGWTRAQFVKALVADVEARR